MKDRFDLRLQPAGYHRLGHSVRDRWHAKGSRPTAMRFRYLHRLHRRRKVRPRGHPIPDLVQVVLQILLEYLERHPVHTRRTLIGFNLPIGLPYLPLRNIKRLT